MRTLLFHPRLDLYFLKKKQGGRGGKKSESQAGSLMMIWWLSAPRNYNKRTENYSTNFFKMVLYFFRDSLRHWRIHIYSLWTRKDIWGLSPPSVKSHQVTPSPPTSELKSKVKKVSTTPWIWPCSHLCPLPFGGGRLTSITFLVTLPGGYAGGCWDSDFCVYDKRCPFYSVTPFRWHPPTFSEKKDAISVIVQKRRILNGAPTGILLSFYLWITGFKIFSYY